MCGIAGLWSNASGTAGALPAIANAMANAVAHRGPDSAGVWTDAVAGIALAHRRLSIVDLSAAGHQPMASVSGRFILAFNGEIYNHAELRARLQVAGAAPAWRGHADTEALLAAIEYWGLEATLAQCVGMFAIALWDARERVLHLARDRFGEKPLYYGWVGSSASRAFVFGSELKALRAFPGFANRVCRQALVQYLRFSYVPAPRSIYKGIFKLEPGCVLTIRGAPPQTAPSQPLRPPASYETLTLNRWWSLAAVVEDGARNHIVDEVAGLGELEHRLDDAIRLQSLADVPLGAFLSGGVDSSLIVALMQKHAMRPVKTFTVGFEEAGFDESPHARAVARHLGTEHTEMFVTASEAREVIAQLPTMYDEPFADSSQIPTYLVCRAARRHVTVALSGDAGDELFGGYNRYFWGPRIWKRLAWMPYPARQALAATLAAVPVASWDALGGPINALLPGADGISAVGEKAHKLAARLRGARNLDDLYVSLVSQWQDPAALVLGETSPIIETLGLLADPLPCAGMADGRLRMMYRDSVTYLPDDILCKVDRAAMAVSLETRVPFLDHRIAELAWQLPPDMKLRAGQGKWALRQVLYKYVPRDMIERPKSGFAIPLGQWLRGPLREWADTLLGESRLIKEGYLNTTQIRQAWQQHLSGRRDWTTQLWAILMFQAWLERTA